jgi:Domain of unknown function (DUF5666)
MNTRVMAKLIRTSSLLVACAALAGSGSAAVLGRAASQAQPTGQAAAAHPIGTIETINGNNITLRTDAKAGVNVVVQDGARIVRVEPGQKDLKGATAVQLKDLQPGDRILVRGTNSDDGKSVMASAIILMKKTDISQMQDQQRQEWQRGVGGLVKSVDPATQSVVISSGAGPTAKSVTIHVSQQTALRRYAPGSVNFADAQPAAFDQIKPGDQLRARGQRNADGTEFTAQEIVSGSFRNIAGTVSSVNASANQLTVMDLLTKKPVVVSVTSGSEVRKLPAVMAQMIAMRLKGGAGTGAAGAAGAGSRAGGGAGQTGSSSAPGQSAYAGRAQTPGGGSGGGWRGSGGGSPDFQQMLGRLPAATLSDLNKGDAVMIVSTEGTTGDGVTAITLLAGVEPILTAPASSQAMLLSPWSLGGPSTGDSEATTP